MSLFGNYPLIIGIASLVLVNPGTRASGPLLVHVAEPEQLVEPTVRLSAFDYHGHDSRATCSCPFLDLTKVESRYYLADSTSSSIFEYEIPDKSRIPENGKSAESSFEKIPPTSTIRVSRPVEKPSKSTRIEEMQSNELVNGRGDRSGPGINADPFKLDNSVAAENLQNLRLKLDRKTRGTGDPALIRNAVRSMDLEEFLLRRLLYELELGSLDTAIGLLERLIGMYPGDGDYRRMLILALNLKDGDIWYDYQRKTSARVDSRIKPPPEPVRADSGRVHAERNSESINSLKQELWYWMSAEQSRRARYAK